MDDTDLPLDRPDDRGAGAIVDPLPADEHHHRQDGPIAGRDPESQQPPEPSDEEPAMPGPVTADEEVLGEEVMAEELTDDEARRRDQEHGPV